MKKLEILHMPYGVVFWLGMENIKQLSNHSSEEHAIHQQRT